jgi:hypothetical protein
MNVSVDALKELEAQNIDLRREVFALRKEINDYKKGFQGTCYTCEPVAELNQKLADAGHALYHAVGYFTDDFAVMNDREYLFTAERAAINKWRELFDNNIPEQNYED